MRRKIITDLYYGPDQGHRKYHTYEHAFRVATFATDYVKDTELENHIWSLWVAGIWHDAVYEIGRTDNEEMSAQALLVLHPNMPIEADMVRRTTVADHLSDSITFENDAPQAILLDADLISLSDPYDTFIKNQILILEENGLEPTPTNLRKSAEFLQKFLSKKSIYRAPKVVLEYEDSARENISKFINQYGV